MKSISPSSFLAVALRWGKRIVIPGLFITVLFALSHFLHDYHYSEIVDEIASTPWISLLFSLGLCVANYIVLTFYDALAIRYIKKDLSYRRTALASFISYTFSQNIGFALLSGGAVRYHLYSSWGFSTGEIGKIIAFTSLHFWSGLFLLFGLTCFIEPQAITHLVHGHTWVAYSLGVLSILPLIAYLLMTALWRRTPIALGGKHPLLPSFTLAACAIVVASLDWLLASGVLYALLPRELPLSHFLSVFFVSQALGVISHVPGGLGIFETSVVFLFRDYIPAHTLIGALILYRAIYYVIPFIFGASLLLAYQFRGKGLIAKFFADRAKPLEAILHTVVPTFLSISAFVAGTVLLFSGATPTVAGRLSWMNNILPLPLIEASHFLNSIVAIVLMFLAWSIRKKIADAYFLTLIFLGAGAALSIIKGLDYEEAACLILTFCAFLPCKKYFYRKAALFSGFNVASLGAIIVVVIASVWLGFFSYKHVQYSHELWWQFEFEGDAPRFLRASVAAGLFALIAGLRAIFTPQSQYDLSFPDNSDIQIADHIIKAHARCTSATLVFLRDKFIHFNSTRTAFIMYRTSGRYWIAMGDPVGPIDELKDLIWEFRDHCDHADGHCVFYQISSEMLPHYLDAGLTPFKIGEEAIVALNTFSLEGTRNKAFRNTMNRLEKDGWQFSIRPAEEAGALLPDMRSVSDEWLTNKNTQEKGFSLGFFDEEYLKKFPVAVVEREGSIMAFANVLTTSNYRELSIDLMRYRYDTPNGIMDYLFLNLMQWGRQQGYKQFNLGMAPLSGLEPHRLSPIWNKIGSYIFTHGEDFYNFEGLRKYKEKFSPEWIPKYIVSPGKITLPIALSQVSSLISGGTSGIFTK
jgi:phosphatidylglycerol lysyltransferase